MLSQLLHLICFPELEALMHKAEKLKREQTSKLTLKLRQYGARREKNFEAEILFQLIKT